MRRTLTAIFALLLAASVANAQSTSRGVTTWEADEQFFLSLNASYGACPSGSYISAITFGGAPTCTSLPPFGGALLANLNFNGYLGINIACPTTNGEAVVVGCGVTLNSVNTGFGIGTLTANSGSHNVAFGGDVLQLNTTGGANTGIGFSVLAANTTGNGNTAVGDFALGHFNDTGSGTDYNTAVGVSAGNALTTGTNDIFLGNGGNITTGSNNILIGNSLTNTTATGSFQFDIGDTIYGPLVGGSAPTSPITVAYGLVQTPQTPAPSTAVTFNWAQANNFIPTVLTANTTVTFTNKTAGQHITVIFLQAAGGGKTVTWPTVRWLSGSAPTMTATDNAKDRYDFYYDGVDVLGVALQGF